MRGFRLGKKQCLVQELPAIEGLARVDTVCLDKTGTLTEASMDIDEVLQLLPDVPAEARAFFCAADRSAPHTPSLQAIIESYPAPEDWRRTATAPFSSARRWSGASFVEPSGAESAWLLGAPDTMLPAGHSVLTAADSYGARGLRVLDSFSTQFATARDSAHGILPPYPYIFWSLRTARCRSSSKRAERQEARPPLHCYFGRPGRDGEGDLGRQRAFVFWLFSVRCRERSGRWTPGSCPRTRGNSPTPSRRTPSSGGSGRSRSGTWWAPCSRGTPWRMTGTDNLLYNDFFYYFGFIGIERLSVLL
ncbi:hypothetical protein [Streptomyces sp. DHE17-7]|uniref:hypothetical protein n=1 Tax=Streptomyces sp. DHE17-7 TaxID=2759949 RepID=UPI003FA7AB6D